MKQNTNVRWLNAPHEISWSNMRHFAVASSAVKINGVFCTLQQEVALPQVKQELGDTTIFWLDGPEQRWLANTRQHLDSYEGWTEGIVKQALKIHTSDPVGSFKLTNASYCAPKLTPTDLYLTSPTAESRQHVQVVQHWNYWMTLNQLSTSEVHMFTAENGQWTVILRYSWTPLLDKGPESEKSNSIDADLLDQLLETNASSLLCDSTAAEDGDSLLLRSDL